MAPLSAAGLPGHAHPTFVPGFRPLLEAQSEGKVRFAVTTLTLAEVLTGAQAEPGLAARYRTTLGI